MGYDGQCMGMIRDPSLVSYEYVPSPSIAAVSLLKGVAMVLSYLFRQGEKFADDYRSGYS